MSEHYPPSDIDAREQDQLRAEKHFSHGDDCLVKVWCDICGGLLDAFMECSGRVLEDQIDCRCPDK